MERCDRDVLRNLWVVACVVLWLSSCMPVSTTHSEEAVSKKVAVAEDTVAPAAAAPATVETPAADAALSVVPDRVYRCADGYQFSVSPNEGAIRLWPQGSHTAAALEEVDSAMGARFEGADMVFWGRGEEALIEVEEQIHTGCVEARGELPWERARVRGIDFRAIGNEPGWMAEVDYDGGVEITLDYGRKVYRFAVHDHGPLEGVREIGFRGRDADHRFVLGAVREECSDSMSGAGYPWQVELTLDERTFTGCGRHLTP